MLKTYWHAKAEKIDGHLMPETMSWFHLTHLMKTIRV